MYREYEIGTLTYDADIPALVARRLSCAHSKARVVAASKSTARVELLAPDGLDALSLCIAEVLLYDLAHFELARMIDDMPLDIDAKQLVLARAARSTKEAKLPKSSVAAELAAHFAESESLILEGFMRFRMRDALRTWELIAARAAEEMVLREEYLELMGLLSAFVMLQPTHIAELIIVMNPDGTCTLTDDSDTRICCERDKCDNVINLLISLSPKSIIVYDLSFGESSLLIEAIKRVFTERVSVRK